MSLFVVHANSVALLAKKKKKEKEREGDETKNVGGGVKIRKNFYIKGMLTTL